MLYQVCAYVKQNTMINKGDRIVVGVSGGADSVCLLYVLNELKAEYDLTLIVVHVNHGIRGKEALRDQLYVEELSKKLDLPYYGYERQVKKLAAEEGLSEEEAGRKARYDIFFEVCKINQCNKIAIAHNRNDNAETVLFHLFRGSGIKGLSGIDPVRKIELKQGIVTLIRPLMCISRPVIEEFLSSRGIHYETDQTNLSNDYSRNKIRNQLLPIAVSEINTNAILHIAEAAGQLREIEKFVQKSTLERYQALVVKKENKFQISVMKLKNEDIIIQKGIIRMILDNLAGRLKNIEAKHIDQVLALCDKQVGKQFHLPYDMIAFREYNDISFFLLGNLKSSSDLFNEPLSIPLPGKLHLPEINKVLETMVIPFEKKLPIPKNSCTKWFDYDKIENAVVIRSRKEGDYIQINRLGGKKKIKDYFIDQKLPKKERDNCLLVADGNHIMWVLGYGDRISEKYKVDEKTNRILLMRMIDLEE